MKHVCDRPVYDVDDAVGCRQVLLDDRVQSAGIIHQDELLQQENHQCVYMHFNDLLTETKCHLSPFWALLELCHLSPLSYRTSLHCWSKH